MFRYTCPLRWSDLDAQGHVNNALLIDYLQEARVAFLATNPASTLLGDGLVVVGHRVAYRRPVGYSGDGVEIELGTVKVGGARYELGYRLSQNGERVADARTVLCPFDFSAQRPVRLSPLDREFFASHTAAFDELTPLDAPRLDGRGEPVAMPVRWSDLDRYGHVNNAVVFDYLQQARIEATTRWDPGMARMGAGDGGRMWLVAQQDVDYVAQIPHRVEPFVVLTAPVRLGRTSLVLAAEMIDPEAGVVFIRSRTALVSADADGRPVDLSDDTRRLLAEHLVD
ncbi:MAG TPA: thioesterase family protein [Arachnia sp.]|nr:thioesterase family protein [Arachnia sp.]HMT85520.1 thioesterase family protein [Arachnia sp.]